MSKFWLSGEIQADVDGAFMISSNAVDAEINRRLEGLSFGGKVEQWALIAIIRKIDRPEYGEVVRKSSRGKVLEFRLKIPHDKFLSANPKEQIHLILEALSRSVALMERLDVSPDVQSSLLAVLSGTQKELVGEE